MIEWEGVWVIAVGELHGHEDDKRDVLLSLMGH